jgi:aspartate ammonia-lyase
MVRHLRLLATPWPRCARFEAKALEFKDVLKMGRTQLQDAVPMTLGQEFADLRGDARRRRSAPAARARALMRRSTWAPPPSAPASTRRPAMQACAWHLAQLTGCRCIQAPDLVAATQDTGAFVQLSGVLKRVRHQAGKTCNDLRLLSSGRARASAKSTAAADAGRFQHHAGQGQPGDPGSGEPGCVRGDRQRPDRDHGGEAGQLQLNAFEPIMGYSLFKSLAHLGAACTRCGNQLHRRHRGQPRVPGHSGCASRSRLVTALNPLIGYEKAALIAKTALATGGPIDLVAESLGIMTRAEMEALLIPENLTQPVRLSAAPVPPAAEPSGTTPGTKAA